MRDLMSYEIFRDIPAVRFVRCLRRLPGHDAFAVGAGFSIKQATVRCESEWIERSFELEVLRPQAISPAGIAAHPDNASALRAAYIEASESFVVDQISRSLSLAGLPLVLTPGFEWWVTRTSVGYFSIIRTSVDGVPFVAHSAGAGFVSTLLKTWEEYRNPLSLRPSKEDLAHYSRLALKLGPEGLSKIRFAVSARKVECPNLFDFDVQHVQRGKHYVVYLTNGIRKGKGEVA